MLEFRTVGKSHGSVTVLRDLSLRLGPGESCALLGESGSGKSTAIHLAAGLDSPDSGAVLVGGDRIDGQPDKVRAAIRRERIGIVFQQFNLIPSLTVARNLSFQARLAGRWGALRTEALADRLGLSDLLDRYPEQLSGGQQQRVAIGRALLPGPALILADEPTGNLDEATGDAVVDVMLEMVRDSGAALLMATHSRRLAERLDRQAVLGGGRLVT